MAETQPKIAIIGAGPSGTTLARLLHLSKISVTIFEREASLSARTQGGTLDLHTDTALKALKECDLYNDFLKYARFDGEALIICDKKLLKYVNLPGAQEGSTRGRPEIDRVRLREILLNSLPDGIVRWGSRLLKAERDVEGKIVLEFEHGKETGFDLVVGADGAWSKIRPILTDIKPHFSGIAGVSFLITDPKEKHPDLYKLVNRGSIFSFSDDKSLTAQQLGSGNLHIGTWKVRQENWLETSGCDINSAQEIKREVLKDFADWAPELRKFVEVAEDTNIMHWPLYMMPVGNRWDHQPGVTLIGDAAHLMTPFAGEGVNLAMEDARKLAHSIISAVNAGPDIVGALDKEVKLFEEDMFVRAKKVQTLTYNMMTSMFFVEGAPRSTIERYVSTAISDGVPSYIAPIIIFLVYAYFWIFKLFY